MYFFIWHTMCVVFKVMTVKYCIKLISYKHRNKCTSFNVHFANLVEMLSEFSFVTTDTVPCASVAFRTELQS
jgi:hypothetical protein